MIIDYYGYLDGPPVVPWLIFQEAMQRPHVPLSTLLECTKIVSIKIFTRHPCMDARFVLTKPPDLNRDLA
jgi:hypothetical protein